MFKTNLKIAWRNLIKDRQFTFLNVTGLAAGLSCALLIFFWVNDELGVDGFFANDDRLFQVLEHQQSNGSKNVSAESSGLLSEALKIQMPEVEYASPLAPPGWFPKCTLTAGDKNFKAACQYAGKDYFKIFSFRFIDGNADAALASSNSIVISDVLAKNMFGTTEGLTGKAIRFNHDTTFFISGVFEQPTAGSSQQFDCVMSWDYFQRLQTWVTSWNNIGPLNFVLLKKGTNVDAFNQKIAGIIQAGSGDSTRKAFVAKFSSQYLNSESSNGRNITGKMGYVKMFSLIAVFILVIACINFMNLSTARASGRMKEVGIKKVVGAGRRQLIGQFLAESILLTAVAGMLAVLVAAMLLPAFNQLTEKRIIFSIDGRMFAAIAAIVLVTGLLAGSYPAFYLSKFNPLAVLHGKLSSSFAEIVSRKGLVIFQFTLSTILIVAVLVIYQQLQFIQQTNPGFNKDNVIRIDAEGKINGTEAVFANELKNIPGVVNASYTFTNMVGHTYGDYGLDWPGKDPKAAIYFEGFGGGYDFVNTMGMQLLQGRGFSKAFGTDTANIIINEAAARVMQLGTPVGKTVRLYDKPAQIIGLVKDFHFESFHQEVKPSYILLQPHGSKIMVSLSPVHQKETLAAIRVLYQRYNPGFTFSYQFLDESYQKQYNNEARVSVLSKCFAGLAIVISCLGLFGLAAFTAQKRRKEIGIRKVIGASVQNIAGMLSFEFLLLVSLSLLLSLPVSWWVMNQWLNAFAYRIIISPALLLSAGLLVLLITLLTVSFQSLKAAVANPVKSLRTE